MVGSPTADFRGRLCPHENSYLEIAQLGKLLATVVEPAQVRLGLVVDDLVGAHVTALSEPFPTDFAMIWTLPGVAAFVSLCGKHG